MTFFLDNFPDAEEPPRGTFNIPIITTATISETPDFARARPPRVTGHIPNQSGPANGDCSLGHLPKPISFGDDKLLTFAELANRIRLGRQLTFEPFFR